jgi:WD40 repeat protein
VWDAETGQPSRTLSGHAGALSSVTFAPDGKLALSGSHDGTVRLWDVKTGKLVRVFSPGKEIYAVAFSPDGQVIAAGGNDRIVRLWNTADGKALRRLEGHANSIIGIAFLPDGQTVVSASSQYQSADRTIRFWDVNTGQEKRSFAAGQRDRISLVGFATSGTVMLSDGPGFTLRRWTLE